MLYNAMLYNINNALYNIYNGYITLYNKRTFFERFNYILIGFCNLSPWRCIATPSRDHMRSRDALFFLIFAIIIYV